MKSKFFHAALALAALSSVAAQERALRPPTIWIPRTAENLLPLQLSGADVRVQVRGHLAATTIELTFFNPNARVLEGELVFPLGEGQTISGYALEVDGKLRQAVSVPKEKAREIFEEIVRRGIDPGLAELTQGNVFRTRIYPIPAQGTKRVAISFEQELSADAQGFRYLLPLGWGAKVGHFHARAEVIRQESIPLVEGPGSAEVLTFEKWSDGFMAELTRDDYEPAKPLVFTVPKLAEAPRSFLVADPRDPTRGFFTARLEPKVPEQVAALKPKRIALFYDASGSAAKRDRVKENEVLRAWFASLGNVTVDLVAFRNDADAPRRFEIKEGDSRELIAALNGLPIDGGTSLGAVDFAATPQADFALLVSDGFSNFGPSEPKLGGALPLFALYAAQAVDRAVLDRLTRSRGGCTIDALARSKEDALTALQSAPFSFLGAEVISGKVADLAPALPTPISRGFSLSGRFEGKCEIELSFGTAGKVLSKQRLVIDPATALPVERGAFVRRVWAQKRIAELELDAKKNEAAIAELGKAHGLVTRFNSLLVLERIEDYVRHRIEPPEPELQDTYFTLLAKQPKTEQAVIDARHLDEVVQQWNAFKAWHDQKHPWIEGVLVTAAKREARIYEALAEGPKEQRPDPQLVAEAVALRARATKLAARLSSGESRRSAESEAIETMLALDGLRQKRIALAPNAEAQLAQTEQTALARQESSRNGASTGTRERALAGAPPPAPMVAAPQPRPALAAAPGRGGGGGGSDAPATKSAEEKDGRDDESKAGKRKSEDAPQPLAGSIAIKPWNPDTPYLKKLRAAEDAYATYLAERSANATSSAFFLDCADFFRNDKKDASLELRVLSNLAEMELESAPLLRILAYRLQQIGRHDLAVPVFEKVLEIRGEEPQSRRDLALSLSRQAQPDHERAARLLWEVISRRWDGRFPEIEVIVLHELNALLESLPVGVRPDAAKIGIDKRCLGGVPVGLRVVLTWDADATDIDLWVTDPAGETVMYSHNRGATGGHVSRDFTGGYGPEVFTIRRPLPGTYIVKANYYGNRQQKLSGATTVQLEFQTAYSEPGSRYESVTRRLQEKAEVIEIGTFTVKLAEEK